MTEEFSNTSNEIQNAEQYNVSMSENNTVQTFKHISSWKYKNPFSVSVSNSEKFSHKSENILKEDKYEKKTKQSILHNCREYLANYQKSCDNISRNKDSFAALIVIMAQATVKSLWALMYIIVNIAPIIQIFSFILRFVFNKIIDIRKTKNIKQVMVKFAIFVIQLLSVYVCLIFILGFIVLPVVQMAVGIVAKFVMHD